MPSAHATAKRARRRIAACGIFRSIAEQLRDHSFLRLNTTEARLVDLVGNAMADALADAAAESPEVRLDSCLIDSIKLQDSCLWQVQRRIVGAHHQHLQAAPARLRQDQPRPRSKRVLAVDRLLSATAHQVGFSRSGTASVIPSAMSSVRATSGINSAMPDSELNGGGGMG